MENEKLNNLRTIIDNRIKELSKRPFDTNIDSDGDEGDEVQGTFMLNMAYECNDRNNAEISLLCEARKKIDQGEYGLCEECDCDIEYKRLMVCPGAKYCIRCAELIERESKLYRYRRTG